MRRTPAIHPPRRTLHHTFLLLLMVAPLAASADDFTLSLTNDSARGYFRFSQPSDQLAVGAGYTYHSGSRHIANVDFHAQGRTAINNLPMTVGLGLRNTYFRDSPIEGGATAPGAMSGPTFRKSLASRSIPSSICPHPYSPSAMPTA